MRRGGGVADAGADADVAGGEMLRAGEGLGDEAAVLDQRRAQRQPLERGVDVGDVLAGDDEVVAGQAAGEVGDGVLEGQRVGGGVDVDALGGELRVGLVGHALLAEAGEDVDAVALAVEVAGEQPDLGLLAADDEPGEDEEDADRGRGLAHRAKTICRKSGRSTRQAAEEVGAVVEGDDVGDQVAADRVAVGAEERDGLGGEAAAVPERRRSRGARGRSGRSGWRGRCGGRPRRGGWRRARPGRRRGR